MSDDRTPKTLPERDAALRDLQARIDKARGAEGIREGRASSAATPSGLGVALRLSSELVAGVVVGGGLGWFVDRTFETSPFGLMALILIGFAAGTLNLVRAAARPKQLEMASEKDPKA